MPALVAWTLTLLYTAFIIYISTTSLPAELPDDPDDDSEDDDSGGGGGGGGGGPDVPPPPEPDPLLRPVYSVRDLVPNFQVFANIGLYLFFGLLMLVSLSQVRRIGLPMAFLGCALLGLLLSMSMEFTQSFLDRVTDIEDVIANITGVLIGAFIGVVATYIYRRRRPTTPSAAEASDADGQNDGPGDDGPDGSG